MSFLEMSVMGGIMALVITVLRAVFLNKLPKRTFVFLWEVSLLRLLLPLSIPAITSVYTLFVKLQTAPPNDPEITVINAPAVTNVMPEEAFFAAAEPLQENVSYAFLVWTIVWAAGVVIAFWVFVLGYILVYRKYRYATIVKDGYPAEWLAEQKLIRKVGIYRSGQALSPLTYGIFRPVILLPQTTDTEKSEQLDFILTHELTHIKRFDMLRKMIAAAVLCLHWFNPAVWALFLLYNRDIELACDEAVVRKTKGDCRSAYAMALIGMEERQRGFSSLFSHFSKNAIEERIVAIMKTKKAGLVTGVAACMLAVSVTCSFATSAATNDKKSEGKTYYSFDNGKTFVKSEDTYIHIPNVEWWTYDEYKAWLEEEKAELQKCLGEKAWTGGRGDFVWTQEMIDETIAMYEDILEQIKNGVKVSKSVDGDENTMLMQAVPVAQISEMSADELNEIAELSKDEVLEKFGKYGISFDGNDKMLYGGEPVRFFCDGCETDGGWVINSSFYDENGKIDVYAVYEKTDNGDGSVDPMGKLVGLRKASKEEFDNVNFCFTALDENAVSVIYDYTAEKALIPGTFDIENNSYEMSLEDEVTEAILAEGTADHTYYAVSIADENSTVMGTSFEKIFAKYKKYGIEYKAVPGGLGNVYFNGELVKKFYDMTDTGAFSLESTDGGKIFVSTVYDENGNLVGVKEVSPDSFHF